MWPFTKQSNAQPTLKARVAGFWKWFEANSGEFYAVIEDKRCTDLHPGVSATVDKWLPGMAWVFGPGADQQGHSFTLSGEGILPKQFVAEYWLQQAPELSGWTFYASRQPSEEGRGFILNLDEEENFKPIEFWVSPYVNDQTEKIDIRVWHPSLHRLERGPRFTALFLMLDEILGEHGTQNWIGEIEFSEEQLKQSIPIFELRELIRETETKHGWKKYTPVETYSSYQLKEQETEWTRSDTVAGSSRYFDLLSEYFKNQGPCEHPLPELGIDYVFVAISTGHFPKGTEVDGRGQIEDDIIEALGKEVAGISLGGATGYKNCYIDFALYDGARSLEILKTTLRKRSLPPTTKVYFLTSDRASDILSI